MRAMSADPSPIRHTDAVRPLVTVPAEHASRGASKRPVRETARQTVESEAPRPLPPARRTGRPRQPTADSFRLWMISSTMP
ncbi:hypothetical protein ACFPM0_00740 [Pseudonocardia sulfidoxydans]|uniref:hypothetical protein n=1 Tax=Pseudonocardia sulfidoxydans TaxID=54011 RepID=UPI00360CA53E